MLAWRHLKRSKRSSRHEVSEKYHWNRLKWPACDALGMESIPGKRLVVPLVISDTAKARIMVKDFPDNAVFVVGLNFPVVPEGNQAIRIQINVCHTHADSEQVLQVLEKVWCDILSGHRC